MNTKKYPKSNKGHQCLTPCVKPGEFLLHPYKLIYTTNENSPFCLVNEYKILFNKKYITLDQDACKKPINIIC